MQTKNLIKIIKAEATVLVSMIESLPEDGDVQPFAIEMLQSKIRDLNNIAVHLSSAEAEIDNASKEDAAQLKAMADAAQKAGEEKAQKASEISGKSWISALEKKVIEDEANKKIAEAEKLRKAAAEEEARRIAAEEESARIAAEAEKARKAAEEEAARRAAETERARKIAEEQAAKEVAETKSKTLAEEFADNTVNVEHSFSEEAAPETESDSKPSSQQESQPTTLADKFQQHVPSINDVLAGLEKKADIASRYNKRPISDLRKAIKINDRMLFINELFNHDSAQYEQTINMIEQANGIDEVLAKIFSQYQWNQEDKTVIDFLELIYQRFKK